MRKRIVLLGCAVLVCLTGCSMQDTSQNDGTQTGSIMEKDIQTGIPPDPGTGNTEMDAKPDDAGGREPQENLTEQEDIRTGVLPEDGTQNAEINKNPDDTGERNAQEEDATYLAAILSEVKKRELQKEGNFRGQLAPGHTLSIGRLNPETKRNMAGVDIAEMGVSETDLTESVITFCMVCKQDNAECKIILVNTKTGEKSENTIEGTGTVSFEVHVADGYSVALENLSGFDVDFTLDYFTGGSI